MYLIDTSVWVDFLRGATTPRVHLLEFLLDDGDAALCDITFAEICFGAQDQRQFARYHEYFSALPFLDLPPQWSRELARMGHHVRRNGYRPFVADLMIALVACTHGAPLLTQDRDFRPFAQFFGLQLA